MVLLVPVTVPEVAVIVWGPVAFSVALKVPAPLLSVVSPGRVPAEVEVKWTVPPNAGVVLLNWSWAVTVKLKAKVAATMGGATTRKWSVAAGLTLNAAEVAPVSPVEAAVRV